MKVCRKCHATHDGKKWVREEISDTKGNEKIVLCEACKRKRDKIVHGIVYLSGPVLNEKKDDVIKMVLKEEEREICHNHLSQILNIEHENDHMTITTINQWLAMHLGQQIKKQFKGSLQIDRDTAGRRGRGDKGREEVVVSWKQAA
jgi:hypothetical protein